MGVGTIQFDLVSADGGGGGRGRREAFLKCPRCSSFNTKFCYYNNYNKSQPRHYCKSCKRHWTRGGTLRNVPVGGGGKNKRPLKQQIGHDQKTLFRSTNYNKTNPPDPAGLNGSSHQNRFDIDDVEDPTYNNYKNNNQSLISYEYDHQYPTGNINIILDSLEEESSIITSSASVNSWEWDWNEIDAFMNNTTNNY